ncbi:signal peptidase I [Sulfurifustis variabilis]|uniref:Signal peptidase I n=1 Tax=Sulfurifustis variabilis TaxID=1675686 RepID=A0A1B4VDL3_9GAMM|nr:signal peptidase I [Sulfurifustis variabilis]BAU48227.1 signal peptidase I [Sulfurifustis variabilis]
MDFSLILFVLVLLTGVVWALDRWFLAGARERRANAVLRSGGTEEAVRRASKEPVFVEYARAFFPVILIVFLLRSFIVEPFRIPSGSMLPSLHIGDFILVNKFAYGVRLPVVNKKIVDLGAPKRGDVLVFRFPGDESINYIKRVIGLPGDRIVYQGKKLYVNGELMEQTPAGAFGSQQGGAGSPEAALLIENLSGVSHEILVAGRPDHTPSEYVVPAGHYFVMGDNRDQSNDSRFWGYVPDENLVGKAFLIWFSWDASGPSRWFFDQIVFERIGATIR